MMLDDAAEGPSGERMLLFHLGARVYACPVADVREIVPYRRATRVPGAPVYVQGLVNLRGVLVTVIDVGVWLEPSRPPRRGGSIILVDHGTHHVGLAVDAVMDVQPVTPEALDDVAGARGGAIRGVGHLEDMVVILLDIGTLVEQVLV